MCIYIYIYIYIYVYLLNMYTYNVAQGMSMTWVRTWALLKAAFRRQQLSERPISQPSSWAWLGPGLGSRHGHRQSIGKIY